MDMASVKHRTNNATTDSDQAIESNPNLGELHDKVDSLWISYLNHLDAYISAQKLLQKHMKAGYMSLAKANFEARNGVRKYGQDYYHDRAVATKRTVISHPGGEAPLALSIVDWKSSLAEDEEGSEMPVKVEKTGEGEEDVTQLPSPPGTPEPAEADVSTKDDDQADGEESKGDQMAGKSLAKLPLECNPLKWFGILVPAALRSAQASFLAAVEEAVLESVTASRAMRSVEVEIRKLRKDIRKAERGSVAARS
jgi:coiled-coil domain-containing protein 115